MKLPNAASNVNEVLETLQALAEEAAESGNPNGLFFALYRLVTKKVKQGIEEKKFENPNRMEAVDVAFANVLFDQVRASRTDSPALVESWRFFFEAQCHLTAAQHMLLGVAPHILHDLAIAIWKVVPEQEIEAFHHDYLQINGLLSDALDQTQEILAQKSLGMRIVDFVLCRVDESIAMDGLALIRDQAFEGARRLATGDVVKIQQDLDVQALTFQQATAARATTCILCGVGVLEQQKFRDLIAAFLKL